MSATEQIEQRSSGAVQTIREHAPNRQQVVGFLTLLTVGTVVLVLGGLTLGGGGLLLLFLTPLFIFFSPILVPLITVSILAIGGFLAAGGFVLATVSALAWLYNYYKGRHPPGSDQVDAARSRLLDTASHLKDRARDYSSNVQDYLQSSKQQALDAAPGA